MARPSGHGALVPRTAIGGGAADGGRGEVAERGERGGAGGRPVRHGQLRRTVRGAREVRRSLARDGGIAHISHFP